MGEVGEPEADHQDRGAEQHVAAELDERGDEVAHLGEVQPVRGFHSGEQHGEKEREAAYQP
ncbi:hypothetical protein D3C83_43330 [compost metagenome]